MKNIVAIAGFSDPVSSWTHLLAAVGALVGGICLVYRGRGSGARMTALGIYAFTMLFLFSMSGVYHILEHEGDARAVLRRLDHAAIWTMIAGTFTPIHVILFRGPWRWAILLLVWTIAITGLTLEVIFFDSIPEPVVLALFLGLGWVGLFSGLRFRALFRDRSLNWLIAGGIAYSIGATMDILRWPVLLDGFVGPHEIFHLFVIAGALMHAVFIWHWAGHPVANTLHFVVRVFADGRYVATAVGERLRIQSDSLPHLKEKIRAEVRRVYHDSIQPVIHLRYSNEEILEA